MRGTICCVAALGALLVAACNEQPQPAAPPQGAGTAPPPMSGYGQYGYGPVAFNDAAQTNTAVDPADLNLTFLDIHGRQVDLAAYRGQKNLVLVFTRGFYGQICPFCTTQTSRLIANYGEFAKRDAEVLVAFPGDKTKVAAFLQAVEAKGREEAAASATPVAPVAPGAVVPATPAAPPAVPGVLPPAAVPATPTTPPPGATFAIPFPLVLDEEFKAVDQLGIRGNLAKPSTYILDKQGQVRFAYVGAHDADRPSVKALLAQLDALVREAAPAAK